MKIFLMLMMMAAFSSLSTAQDAAIQDRAKDSDADVATQKESLAAKKSQPKSVQDVSPAQTARPKDNAVREQDNSYISGGMKPPNP